MARILVVDDNQRLADTIQSFLTLEGHKATAVYNAEDAIDAIGLDPPDVCLLDINMPGLDGLEICRRIKAAVPATVVVMMSGRTAPDDEASSLAAGAVLHLHKPVSLERLRTEIANLLPTG